MQKLSILNKIVRERCGEKVSVHFDYGNGLVAFRWGIAQRQSYRSAQASGILFEGVNSYRAGNLDNLLIGDLETFTAAEAGGILRCSIKIANFLGEPGDLEFAFHDWSRMRG